MQALTVDCSYRKHGLQVVPPTRLVLALLSSLCVFSEASAAKLAPADPHHVVYGLKQTDGEDFAKRAAPQEVPPVVHGDIEFVVIHFASSNGGTQNGGYLEARDKATGKKLWGVQVYTTAFDKNLERDVQDVFITKMTIVAKKNLLHVKDEMGREYTVDIKTQKVTPLAK